MKCELVKLQLIEDNLTITVTEHLSICPECVSFQKALQYVSTVVERKMSVEEPQSNTDIPAKKSNLKYVAAAAVLFYFIIAFMPHISPGIAGQLEKIPGINYLLIQRNDTGLIETIPKAKKVEASVTEQGITFTVHTVVADSARLIACFSVDGVEIKVTPNGEVDIPLSVAVSDIYGMIGASAGYQISPDGPDRIIGILDANRPPLPGTETVEIRLTLYDLKQDWLLEVPVEWMTEGDVSYKNLTAEKDRMELIVDELAFGITGTQLRWQIMDWDGMDGVEGRGYLSGYHGPSSRIPLLVEEIKVTLFDKYRQPVMPIGNSIVHEGSEWNFRGRYLYPPLMDRNGLKVRAEGFIMRDVEPFSMRTRRFLGRWSRPSAWLHKTFLHIANVEIRKQGDTVITLEIMHGDLAYLEDFYLLDRKGNRYELIDRKVEIPDIKKLQAKAKEEYKKGNLVNYPLLYSRLKKYYELRFEPLPAGEKNFTLHAGTVLYRSPLVLEVDVPNE